MKLIYQRQMELPGGVHSFAFTPKEAFTWEPGQSIRLELPTLYGPEDHRFTIASAPHHGEVIITTRVSKSLYKKALSSLEPGFEADAYGLEGGFVWHDDVTQPKLFVASGLGITPYYAMLAHRAHHNLPIPATLLYAYRDDNIPYRDQLEKWQKAHPELRIQFLPGVRMSAQQLTQLVPNLHEYHIYVAGPSRMVDIICNALINEHHFPESQLQRDWFTGQMSPDD